MPNMLTRVNLFLFLTHTNIFCCDNVLIFLFKHKKIKSKHGICTFKNCWQGTAPLRKQIS